MKLKSMLILFSFQTMLTLFFLQAIVIFFQLTGASGNVFTKVELPTFNDFIEKIKSNFANNN